MGVMAALEGLPTELLTLGTRTSYATNPPALVDPSPADCEWCRRGRAEELYRSNRSRVLEWSLPQ